MAVPLLLPTAARNETFGGVTYHIEGELVPALHVELSNTGVYFEHHILLWKDPSVQVALHPMKGAFKRMLAGMPFLLTGATGPGRIAFSRDGTGHVFALHLKPGMAVDVREHQWLSNAVLNICHNYARFLPQAIINAGLKQLPAVLGVSGGDLDTTTVLARHPVNALFVSGTEDSVIPSADMHRLFEEALPGSKLIVVPGATHETLPYRFSELVPPVLSWLNTNEPGGR